MSRSVPSFQALLVARFNELAEANGECVLMELSALAGFVEVYPHPATGEPVRRRVLEADVLAGAARMSADMAGAFGLARALMEVEASAPAASQS